MKEESSEFSTLARFLRGPRGKETPDLWYAETELAAELRNFLNMNQSSFHDVNASGQKVPITFQTDSIAWLQRNGGSFSRIQALGLATQFVPASQVHAKDYGRSLRR